ncbi:MAG: hypothetical protein ABI861_02355 [Panacibacter sp.]
MRPAFTFILLLLIFSCQKEISFEKYIAAGSLKDSSGICYDAILHGTFYDGVKPGMDTAYIYVKVNVKKPGSYHIYTDTQNGFQFSETGIFNTAGIYVIKLKPGGTPLNHTITDFKISFDTSVCEVTINVLDSALLNQHASMDTLPQNNWKFTDVKRGITHRGLLEVNYIYTLGLQKILVLSSKQAEGPGDSTLLINIVLPAGVIAKGVYTTDDSPNGLIFKTFNDACLNCAGGGLIPLSSGATVNFTITEYNTSTKLVKGRFSGTTIDSLEEIAPITNGEFAAVVE